MQSFDGFDVEVHFVADVGKQEDGHQIARAAQDAFGGFHTWINIENVPDDMRHLWETISGALAER